MRGRMDGKMMGWWMEGWEDGLMRQWMDGRMGS